MSDNDIFSNTADQQKAPTTTEQQVSLLEAMVGEGKKYATPEELAKAYYNADSFIEQLKEENRQLRDQTAKMTTLDEALAKLSANSGSVHQDPSDEVGDVPKNNLDASLVAKLVEQKLAEVEHKRSVEGNLKVADAKLKEVFGEDAKKVFDEVAVTPEMRNSLMTLASSSPDKFVEFFTNLKGKTNQAPPTNAGEFSQNKVNTVNLSSMHSNRVSDPECKEYWNELRRTNPNLYYSQDMQIKMNNAAIKNQQKFFGS